MTISLLQPILNASAVPIFYPAPSRSDVYNCNGFYSQMSDVHTPPPISDCREAFKLLPSGSTATPWWPHPGPERENILPIMAHHGGCEIVFHTSGPEAQVETPTWITPNDIRDMASWVLGKCVVSKKGGMVTKNLANSIDYMTNTSIDFWHGDFATTMSFYSLHIWNYAGSEDEDPDWNPGDSDPDVANKIADALKMASLTTSGDEREELDSRLDFIQEAESSLERDNNGWVWWKLGPRFAQSGANLSSILSHNRTGSTGNLTFVDTARRK